MALASGIAEALFDIVGSEHVRLGSETSPVTVPGAQRCVEAGAVVFPRTTLEVAQLVRGAAACEIPLTALQSPDDRPRPNPDGIVLALNRMDQVLEVDTARCRLRVQPAVATAQLAAAAAVLQRARRWSARSGTRTVCWTSRQRSDSYDLLEFEVVLPTGGVVRVGEATRATPQRDWRDTAFAGVVTELTYGLRPSDVLPMDSAKRPVSDVGGRFGHRSRINRNWQVLN